MCLRFSANYQCWWSLDSIIYSQQTRDATITSLLRQNDVATSFWRNNDVIIAPCAHWGAICFKTIDTKYWNRCRCIRRRDSRERLRRVNDYDIRNWNVLSRSINLLLSANYRFIHWPGRLCVQICQGVIDLMHRARHMCRKCLHGSHVNITGAPFTNMV